MRKHKYTLPATVSIVEQSISAILFSTSLDENKWKVNGSVDDNTIDVINPDRCCRAAVPATSTIICKD